MWEGAPLLVRSLSGSLSRSWWVVLLRLFLGRVSSGVRVRFVLFIKGSPFFRGLVLRGIRLLWFLFAFEDRKGMKIRACYTERA